MYRAERERRHPVRFAGTLNGCTLNTGRFKSCDAAAAASKYGTGRRNAGAHSTARAVYFEFRLKMEMHRVLKQFYLQLGCIECRVGVVARWRGSRPVE